jgi:dipeptidyl aminopeptidase/acylaminoacyl peptidase
LRGVLVVPPTYTLGRRVPLVAIVYPGNRDAWTGVFRNRIASYWGLYQLLATRGYAVLEPSIPLRVGTPMHDAADAIFAAINAAVDAGIADPKRLGIIGHSYGGYGVLSAIVQSPRFSAAVMESGPAADLMAFYGLLGGSGNFVGAIWAEQLGHMPGAPWQYRDQYIENSPIWFLDRVETPLLITTGSADGFLPWLSEGVYVGLHRLGKPVEYRRYEGEGHGVGDLNPNNFRDRFAAVLRWFDTYLASERR